MSTCRDARRVPEALTEGLLKLQEKIMTERWLAKAPGVKGEAA